MLRVIYFTASWCGPCKVFGPTVDRVISQTSNIEYQKVDVDASHDTVQRYSISSVPTLVFEKNGMPIARKSGAVSASELAKLIESYK